MRVTRALVVICLLLSGCGSCQRSREVAQPGAPADSSAATAPLKPSGKIQAAPVQPVTKDTSSTPLKQALEGRESPTRGTPAAAAPGGSTEAGESEGDCIVVVDADPDYGPPPLKVTFSAEAECNVGQPTYKWNFGDGSAPSSDTNPTHTYTQAGDYTAAVTITSPGGATASDEVDITVEEGEGEPQE